MFAITPTTSKSSVRALPFPSSAEMLITRLATPRAKVTATTATSAPIFENALKPSVVRPDQLTGGCLEWIIEAALPRSVSAVIPSYNSRSWLDGCISGLLAQQSTQVSVVVVDNGSNDGSAEYVRARWPAVHVAQASTNLGYGGSINYGAELRPRGDVLAVNADAYLAAGALDWLSSVFDEDRTVGAVVPCLVNPNGSLQPSAYRFPTLLRIVGRAMFLHHIPFIHSWLTDLESIDYVRRAYVEWAAGAVMLIRREAWDAVGGFDPAYFFFVEEIDLQRRLSDAGWRIALEPRAIAVHHGGHQPISWELFLHAHDGYSRYFGLRRGSKVAGLVRASLCLTALTRATAWSGVAALSRTRRREAIEWAAMFGHVFISSLCKIPRTVRTTYIPYGGGRCA